MRISVCTKRLFVSPGMRYGTVAAMVVNALAWSRMYAIC